MGKTDYFYMAETICAVLCSSPDLLARMNKELRELLDTLEDCEGLWNSEQQIQIRAFIDESAHTVSEVVNGNKL